LQRKLLVYSLLAAFFAALLYAVLEFGPLLDLPLPAPERAAPAEPVSIWQPFAENLHHPLTLLLLQLIVILSAAHGLGALARFAGQPRVVGEILAGILLGPTLLGAVAPGATDFLFPPASLPNLQFLSQIGLILFLFLVGMELDWLSVRRAAAEAVVISHASIMVPYTLGVAISFVLYRDFAPPGTPFAAFALFMGIALSITAFPVLARIVRERGLLGQPVGSLALACAAADDATAWCLLAVVVALVRAASVPGALLTLVFAAGFALLMLVAVRPLLATLLRRVSDTSALGIIFVVLLLSAFATEIIGIHALFGAFLAGVIVPADRRALAGRVENVALVFLLPIFFVLTGLRTRIGLLNQTYYWAVAVVITFLAVAGKFFGSALAARWVGLPWRPALMIGALMNTRGLMELVVLNIGYDLGILSAEIFAMLVLMALVTTAMTGPALDAIDKQRI
jgi:Kef-type K+ transport system membrane component KefB